MEALGLRPGVQQGRRIALPRTAVHPRKALGLGVGSVCGEAGSAGHPALGPDHFCLRAVDKHAGI